MKKENLPLKAGVSPNMMNRYLFFILIFVIGLSLVWQFVPLQDGRARTEKLPLEGEGFYGKNIPLSEAEQQFFGDVALIKRSYKINEGTFFLIVLDGTHNRHAVHDPRYCFEGQGWTITKERAFAIPNSQGGTAGLFTISKKGVEREAMAWYSDGKKQFVSPWEYWWKSSLRRLTFGYSGEEPLLVLLQSEGKKKVNWDQVFHELSFLNTL